MKKQYHVVELRDSREFAKLKLECERLQIDLMRTKNQLQLLEQKYGYEVYLNNELVDLCKSHGVPFRRHLDHNEREVSDV